MSARDDGGPAFPLPDKEPNENGDVIPQWTQPGMTLRDWFAGMALQGVMAGHTATNHLDPKLDADYCYSVADAMLAARVEP